MCTTATKEAESDLIVVKLPSQLERELGKISPKQMKQVTAILRIFIRKIRAILAHSEDDLKQINKCGTRCATCAFAPETDTYEGFTRTVYALLRALRNTNLDMKISLDMLFLCHANQPGWKEKKYDRSKLKLCGGYEAIVLGRQWKQAHKLATETMEKIKKIAPRIDKKGDS